MRSLHHFTTKAKNALCWPFVDRSRLLLTFVVTTIVLGSCIWFFASKDKQGDSARLTADAWYYHAYLPSLVFDQDLDFTDEYKITKNWYRLGKTPTGRTSKATIVGEKANGFSKSEVKLSLFASLLFSLGALFFGARLIARRLGGRYGPLAVALLTAAGGPVIYYAIRQPGYAHPFATFWAAWLIDYWDKSYRLEDTSPRSQRFWICMGLLIGAASLARPQLVLWSILGGYAAASDLARARALGFERVAMLRLVRHWLVGASCALLIVLPQLLAWNALYGSLVASPQGEGFMRWGESAWFDTLMSSRNGLFPWAPLYALGFLGLLVGIRRHTRLCSALLLGLFLQAYANGAAWDWWAGGSFGGRRFDSCYIGFAFGLGIVLIGLWRVRPKKRVPLLLLRAGGLYLAALSMLLALANMDYASRQSAKKARIYGGQSASSILGKRPGITAGTAGWASSLSNLPARILFAWRNDTGLNAYDKVVGVHQLGELFPGLNSFRGKKREKIDLNPAHPRVRGVEEVLGKFLVPTGEARLFFGLNRIGPVTLELHLNGAAPTVRLNGAKLPVHPIHGQQNRYTAEIANYNRGSNRLDIASSPDCVLYLVELSTSVNAAGLTPAP